MELSDVKPKQVAPLDMFGNEREDVLPKDKTSILAKRFAVVPFSVLNARDGYWQERKREWIALGIKGEEGRQDTASANNICSEQWGRGQQSEFYDEKREYGAQQTGPNSPYRTHGYNRDATPGGGGPNSVRRLAPKDAGKCFGSGRPGDLQADFKERETHKAPGDFMNPFKGEPGVSLNETLRRKAEGTPMEAGLCYGEVPSYDGAERGTAGTSVFDPVLCECLYKWFCPPGGAILDPFAGESTKGIVAGFLGYNYTGIELRPSQIEANKRQAAIVAAKVQEKKPGEQIVMPTWVQGDSANLGAIMDEHRPFEQFDFIWTSPPYYDLEIYSKSEKDGSAFETYPKFMAWYKDIFAQAVARLKENRFLAVKVGEIRDDSPSGFYRNFEYDNIRVFEELGLRHYNRIVLVTAVGSLPVRIGSQFPKYRKVGNTHQMVYIFWKGPKSTRCIPEELGVLAQADIERPEEK